MPLTIEKIEAAGGGRVSLGVLGNYYLNKNVSLVVIKGGEKVTADMIGVEGDNKGLVHLTAASIFSIVRGICYFPFVVLFNY